MDGNFDAVNRLEQSARTKKPVPVSPKPVDPAAGTEEGLSAVSPLSSPVTEGAATPPGEFAGETATTGSTARRPLVVPKEKS